MDELRQFRRSHYNEKARWALDYKQWPHRRRTLLPGPHMPGVRALTGQSATPIFCLDGRWIAGSSAIIAALEARAPTPALYPADPGERAAALEIERRFDEELGPRMRRAVFGQLLPTPTYIARIFSEGRPALERGFYTLTSPLAAPLIKAGNGIRSQADVEDGERAVDEAFEWAAAKTASRPYLVGDAFSVADLTAAAFLALAIELPNTPMDRPMPMPARYAAWLAKRADHPAAAWVRRMYSAHRALTHDFEGVAPYAALATNMVPAE